MQTLQQFYNFLKCLFWPPKIEKKKNPQKLLRIPKIHFFPLTALTAQTTQTEEFMFQNVAYWHT